MRIRIVCPVSCAYEGDAAFVSIPSTDGEFGVLPAHSSEICTIDRGYVRVSDKAMGTVDHTFAVAGGYAQVADDVVTVLAERACDLATVDADKVKADIQDFEEKLGNLSEDDAKLFITEKDKRYHKRHMALTGSNRGDRHNRDMLIDSSLLGVDGTAELIESLARKVVENESKTEAGGDK